MGPEMTMHQTAWRQSWSSKETLSCAAESSILELMPLLGARLLLQFRCHFCMVLNLPQWKLHIEPISFVLSSVKW